MFDWRVVYCDSDCRGDQDDDKRFFRSEAGARQQADMHNFLYHEDVECAKTRAATGAEQRNRGEAA